MPPTTLAELAALLNCPPPQGPAGQLAITGVATLEEAGETELSVLGSDAYLKYLPATRAAAVVVQKKVKLPKEVRPAVLMVEDADLAIAQVLAAFAPPVPRPPAGVDRSARVAESAVLGPGVAIGPHAFVGQRCRLGRGTVIHPNVYVGDDCALGDDCELFPNVVVRERITLGHRVVIHSGSVLGADGFGYRWDGRRHVKIPQIGMVVIEDDVEIGSCTCVDRAKYGATLIGRGTKIDNLVQVAHNVQTGPHCVIVAQVGIAGSTTLGAGVVLAGQAAVRDHVHLGDGVQVAATAGVKNDVEAGMIVSGIPAVPVRQFLREQAALRRLPELVNQVRKMQEEIARLKEERGNPTDETRNSGQ